MLFSDQVLFVHVPKAGGMSITRYLLNELSGPLALSVPERMFEHARGMVEHEDVHGRLTLIDGKRHETLPEAAEVLRSHGRGLDDFSIVLAIARSPYELELSYFLHLQKPHVQERRGPDGFFVRLARLGDFERFCEEAPFYNVNPDDYFLLDGKQPSNMHIVRFERFAEEVPRLVSPFGLGRMSMSHRNKTPPGPRPALTPRAKRAIDARFPYLTELMRSEES